MQQKKTLHWVRRGCAPTPSTPLQTRPHLPYPLHLARITITTILYVFLICLHVSKQMHAHRYYPVPFPLSWKGFPISTNRLTPFWKLHWTPPFRWTTFTLVPHWQRSIWDFRSFPYKNLTSMYLVLHTEVTDFIFLGSKFIAGNDCSREIKRRLLMGRKAMTNLDGILKSRDITWLDL